MDTYRLIALEDLTLKLLTANQHLTLNTHDAGLAEFQQLLAYKTARAGTHVVTVNPAYTSQMYSSCGAIVEQNLSVCVHRCPDCGLTLDRDVNMLKLAVESARMGPSGANVGCWVECSLRSSLF